MASTARAARVTRSALGVLGLCFILLPLSVAVACLVPSPAAIVAPGPVEPLDALIQVEGRSYAPQGRLYLTTVRVSPAPRLGHYLLALLQPDVQIVPKSEVTSPFLSSEELEELSRRLLQESENIAQVVALRQAGYEVKVGGTELRVVATMPGTVAEEQLAPGDLIEAAAGETVETAAELVSIVQMRVTGEPVALRIRRGSRVLAVTLPTVRAPLDGEGPVLGVVAVTTGFDCRAPIKIQLDAGAVGGGPSGGLMYALGVYNALVTQDITRGHRVAGTGTLRLNGKVGPVGAIRLKVRAAEAAGAEYFLAPVEDAPAARAAAGRTEVIAVGTFQEALQALEKLDSGGGGGPRVVPAGGENTLARAP